MIEDALSGVELIVRTTAETIVANTVYFSDLDAVAGDGDFGFSLASGFEVILADFESLDRSNVGTFLKRIGLVISSKIGGTSGPIWGTAFLRAASAAGARDAFTAEETIAILRSAIDGVMARGGASLGDKTLLDAAIPAIDALEEDCSDPATWGPYGTTALQHAADVATAAAEATRTMVAKRGRAAYTGERSRGSPDAGAIAIGVILQKVSAAWRDANDGRRETT